MALRDMDIGAVLQRLAERKIEQAMQEGKFDNLAGAGQPIEIEAAPTEENARLRWWALKILRQNDFTPDEVRYRKLLDTMKEQLAATTSEERIRALVPAINDLVRRINTMGTNAINIPVVGVRLEDELAALQGRIAAMRIAAETIAQTSPATSKEDSPPPRGFWSSLMGSSSRQCKNRLCKAKNVGSAQFCRRCGLGL